MIIVDTATIFFTVFGGFALLLVFLSTMPPGPPAT